MNEDDRINEFLKELAILTEKYDVEIGGCGCCGSPWLEDLKFNKFVSGIKIHNYIGDYLKYNEGKRIYEIGQ